MKNITVLIALICLVGVAGAQGSSLGGGYSSSQLAFYNKPIESAFDPFVQSYWSNYVAGNRNQSSPTMTTEMDLWVNHFPMMFSTPLKLEKTSFKGDVSGLNLSETDKNSQSLKTEVYRNFGFNKMPAELTSSGSLTTSIGTGKPAEEATGDLISQKVMSFFNV